MVLEYLQSCHSLVLSNRHSLVLFTCLFVSSLPVPFPLMFVLICYWPTLALDSDSSLTPWYFSPVTPGIDPRLSLGPELILDILVCQLTTLDCIPFSGFYDIKENLFFTPEFCLAIGSYTLSLTQWGHSSQLFGHPGTSRTISFIQRKFWWLEMREDIQNFVAACSVCAQAKVR